jgi:light-regulated signal transduction histidine kinase (bacteriophytochrome)
MLAGIEERDSTLVSANEELKKQIRAREQAEQKLKTLNEELERRVEKRTRDLQRSNQELEQFAYVASHDLKEPVRMVISYLQLIEKRYADKLDDQGRQFLHFAVDGGQRMQTLIMDLLTYARVGSEKKPFQQVDLGAVLGSVIADLQVAITESGATITHDAMPTVTGDPAQLGRVLQNLIANSIKFRGEKAPRIHVSALREGQDWRIGVSDNGIGIEPQYFERIFVIFQRLHGRTEYPGTGIGLAVCKRIVERHGGRIWVESEFGKGTTFYFTIGDSYADGI